jgi:hypothetical protein
MTSGYLPRVLTDAEGADVHPGDRVVVQHQRGHAEGVYLGVRRLAVRGHPAVVSLGNHEIYIWRSADWVRVGDKQGEKHAATGAG